MSEQLTTTGNPFEIDSFAQLEKVAGYIASSQMFGIKTPAQAITLMMLCQAEGLNPITALRRYHMIQGRPSMRADAMQGEFESKGGNIIWHYRSDEMVAATFFRKGVVVDDAARKRAIERFSLQSDLLDPEVSDDAKIALIQKISELSRSGEALIIRTYADAEEKGLSLTWKETKEGSGEWEQVTKDNWKASPRQMLTARVVSEGVRLVEPALIAGIYSEDETEDIIRREAMEKSKAPASPLNTATEEQRIRWMIEEKQKELDMDITDANRQRLHGEISDLKLDLEAIYIKETPSRMARAEPTSPAKAPLDPKPVSGSQKGVPSNPRASSKQVPASTEEDAIPGLTVEPPPPPDWKTYRLRVVKSPSYKGRTLEELSEEEIDILFEKRSKPFMDDPNKDIRTEARMIAIAHAHIHEKKGKKK
jgi:hypothetical protein